MKRWFYLVSGLCLMAVETLMAQAVPPLLEKSAVPSTASAERSTLNRTSGVLTSTVDVVAVNLSGRRINGPVHAVVSFKTPAGALVSAGITVPGSQGGFDQAPWQQPFFDLTAQAGADGWQPGEALALPLTFSRDRSLQVLYEVSFAGRINHDPVVDPGGPYAGQVGAAIVFSGAAEDQDGDPLTFTWDFGDGTRAATARAEHAFASAGVKALKLTVEDGNGGVVVRDVTALVIPSGQFALAHTRVVEANGHPLPRALVTETGPQGNREFAGEESGFVSLGASAGDHRWKFTAPGHRPVWRKTSLGVGDLKLVPSPWLAPLAAPAELSVLEAVTLTNAAAPGAAAECVRLVFPAGAFTQPGSARLTALGPQALPFPLGFGWSPLVAFHLDLPEVPTAGAAARLKLTDRAATGELVTLVQFDETALEWKVVSHHPASATTPDELTFTLTSGGTWAAVVRDTGTGAPELPDPGEALVLGTPQNLLAAVTAISSALPSEMAASLDPAAVTGEGEAVFTPASGILPSGSWFRLGVQESYDLTDGTGLRTPDYDTTVYAYRRPAGRTVAAVVPRKAALDPRGGTVSRSQLLQRQPERLARDTGEGRPAARFPLRPRLLFSTVDLKQANVHVDVLPPLGTGASVLSREGGGLESGGIRVTVPPDALGAFAAGSLRALEPTGFAGLVPSGYAIAGVFELNLSGLAPGAVLGFSLTRPVTPATDFMLTRLVSFSDGSGLAPIQRLRSDAAGILTNAEPSSPPRLPGLDGPGQYLLVQLPAAQGLVHGVVRNASGDPVTGISVRVTGQSWLSVTSTDGRYFLTLPAGQGTVLARNSANGDGAAADVTMPPGLGAPSIDLTIGSVAPQVLVTTPVHQAERVPSVTPLIVEFSEKIAPASLGANPLTLRAEGAAADVPTGFTLDLSNRILTLLPVNPLEPATDYTLTVSAGIQDLQNLPLTGRREFTFTTAAPAARGDGAQLVIYEPGGAGPTPADQTIIDAIPGYTPGTDNTKVVATGGPGTVDPRVPVILVNENTGSTATVLSKPDGSFANFIDAEVADLISATFVNANGTRITIPATRQKFDDGRIGLFRQGGILEAENEGVDPDETAGTTGVAVEIKPAAIATRTVFQMRPVAKEAVITALGTALPTEGTVLGGVIASHEAGSEVEARSEIEFTIDPAALTLPPGVTRPEDATFLLTSLQEVDGVLVLEMLDTMAFSNGKLTTRFSPPESPVAAAPAAPGKKRTARLDDLNKRLKNVAEGFYKGLSFPDIVKKQFLADIKSVLSDLSISSLKKIKQPNQILSKLGLPSVGDTVIHQLLLPVMIAQGTTTNIGGRVVATKVDSNGAATGEALPVAGALVTVDQPPIPAPGRLRPGQIVSQTSPAGHFMMRMDVGLSGGARLLSATHPRFPGQRPTENGSIGTLAQRLVGTAQEGGASGLNVQLAKLTFVIPAAPGTEGVDENPPSLRASHAPGLPLAGLATGDAGATVLVAAGDDRSIAELTIRLESVETFDGRLIASEEAILTDGAVIPRTETRMERQMILKCGRPARVKLVVEAADASGNRTQSTYAVDFARPPLVPDIGGVETGPRVMSMTPAANASGLQAFPEIRLRFTKALPAAAFVPGKTDWLVLGAGHFVVSLEPSADRREAVLRFSGKEAGPVTLTIGSPLTDEAGKKFDQNPDEEGSQAFTAGFTLAAPPSAPLDLVSGGGVGLLGGYLFALERTNNNQAGNLVAYDINDPLAPRRVATTGLAALPVDLAVISGWSVIPKPGDGPVSPPQLAVITSEFGTPSDGNDGVGFKSLRLYDVSNPALPRALVRGNISFAPDSQIVKLAAVPPFLVYQEQGADVTSVQVVDLAAFTLGHNATAEQRRNFPENGLAGTDLNGDGDFTDAGEINSQPQRAPATYFGNIYSYAPQTRDERLVDFSLAGGGLLGVITTRPAGGPAVYRNILAGSDPGNPAVGSFVFGEGEDPKRVTVLTDLPVRVGGVLRLMDVALVSMRAGAAGTPALVVLDLSDRRAPRRLGEMPLPPDDGIPNTLVQRGGTTLVLATAVNALTLNSERLLEVDAAGRSLAITGRVAGFGGGVRSFVSDPSGLAAVAASGKNRIAFTGPGFSVVTFPDPPQTALAISQLSADGVAARLLSGEVVAQARKAAVEFGGTAPDNVTVTSPPAAGDHYYVVCRVPGGAAGPPDLPATLPLTVSTVSPAGGYPALESATVFPRLLVDAASRTRVLGTEPSAPGAWPVELQAHRLSNSPVSPLYNVFLAGPFTLNASLTEQQGRALTAQLARAFIRLDQFLYIGLAPKNPDAGNFLSPFQPTLGEGPLQPGSGMLLPCDYRRNPLIFVPGVMASKLRGKGFVTDVWLSVPNLLAQLVFDGVSLLAKTGVLRIEVFGVSIPIPPAVVKGVGKGVGDYFNSLNALSMGPNGEGITLMASDVLRDVNLAGDKGRLEPVQSTLLNYLRDELGYREYIYNKHGDGKAFATEAGGGTPNRDSLATLPDLYPFPYDWRLDNAQNADRLAAYVDLIKDANPEVTNVDVIAHSMGGLVTRRYMMDHPGVVDKFISACSPFLGSPKAANTLKTGDLGELLLNFACGLELGKQISRHMPALHQLMPSKGFFDLGGRPVAERGWDADSDGDDSETLDYSGYRTAMDGPFVYDPFLTPPNPISARNQPFHAFGPSADNNQDNWRGETGSTRIFHIVSATQKPSTISRLRLMPRLVPAEAVPNLALELPPVDFEDSEQIGSSDVLLPPAGSRFPTGDRTFRLEYGLEVDRGMGDGTVPLLSQVRGFGSPLSLNAPGTVMLPLVSRDPRQDPDDLFSHAGMLQNPEFFGLLRGILLGETAVARQPRLKLILPENTVEGSLTRFSVEVAGGPAGETPTVLWDTGDGGFATGLSGAHEWQEDGLHTVTCLVGFKTGPGAVISGQITVGNAAPVVSLTSSGQVRPGAPVRLLAAVSDPGGDDDLTFRWDLGDGTVVENEAPFTLTHRYARTGTFSATVTVTDDDGASATATAPVVVSDTPVPAAPVRSPREEGGEEETDDVPPVEFVELVIGGHDVFKNRSPKVTHQSTLSLLDKVTGFVVDEGTELLFKLRTVQVAQLSGRAVQLRAFRLDPGGTKKVPEKSVVTLNAAALRMDIRMQHHRASGIVKCYEWQIVTEPGDEVTLQIPWDSLDAASGEALRALSDPPAFSARPIPCRDTLPPAIEADFDEVDYSVFGLDLAALDGRPVTPRRNTRQVDTTLLNQRAVFTLEAPPTRDRPRANSPGGSELPTLEGIPIPEGSIAKEIDGTIPRGTEPTGATALIATDANGNSRLTTKKADSSSPVLTEDSARLIKESVQKAFITGGKQPFFKKFVLDPEHILIFEQGTGAALWKNFGKAVLAYTPKVSDNDYEIFLPSVVTPANRLTLPLTQQNPANAEQQSAVARFEQNAFTPAFMNGDWYFLPPEGFEKIGSLAVKIEPPADENDPAQMADYISRVKLWRYTIPPGLGNLEGQTGGTFIDIEKGTLIFAGPDPEEKSVFNNPATPSAVISFVLTENLKRNEKLREFLPDVSFFPFRREHFQMAVMSLEKPPPFGDDPVGDAGMGRGLLLLKWVLEGAFLPVINGDEVTFNVGIDDAAIRTVVFNRLQDKSARLEPEGLEWGLYHEFAALSESAHLLVAPCDQDGNPLTTSQRGIFGDFFSAHDKKTAKKVGKAAIRGVLARLATEDEVRKDLFLVPPGKFDGDDTLPSFEHLIARLGRQHVNDVFGGDPATAELIDDFLAAKIGQSNARLQAILATPASLSRFVRSSFDFLREQVQVPTTDDFDVYMAGLLSPPLDANRVAEHAFRSRNVTAIDLGFATTGGGFRSGRLALHGVQGEASLKYKFALSVNNNTDSNPVNARVELDSGLGGNQQSLSFPVPAGGKTKFPDPDNPAVRDLSPLVISRPASDFGEVIGILTLTSSFDSTQESTMEDNIVFFEHQRLPLGVFRRGGSGNLDLGLDVVENAAAPPGDCFLTVKLRELTATGLGQPLPSATVSYIDSKNVEHPISDGRLRLNRGAVAEPIAWPIFIIGKAGGTLLDAAELDARLQDVFLHGDRRRMTAAQVNFGRLLNRMLAANRDIPANPLGPRAVASALAPSAFNAFNPIATATSGVAVFVHAQPFGEVNFVRNEDIVTNVLTDQRLTVEALVSDVQGRGLTIANLVDSQPQTSRIPLRFADPPWNPGRNGKQNGETFSNGQVFIHDDLMDRALRGETLDFRLQDNSEVTLSAHEPLKVELYHELVFRLLSAAVGEAPNFNLNVDRELVRIFPAFHPLYSGFFGVNPNPEQP